MPRHEEKDVALVIQTHVTRVAPDWELSDALPKKTDLLERETQIFVSSFLVATPLQRYLNLLNEKPVNVLLAESV